MTIFFKLKGQNMKTIYKVTSGQFTGVLGYKCMMAGITILRPLNKSNSSWSYLLVTSKQLTPLEF